MTAKEYFHSAPQGTYDICPFAHYVLYGTEHDYAYIVYENDGGIQSYHRLKVRYTADGSAYVFIHRTKLYIAEFHTIEKGV